MKLYRVTFDGQLTYVEAPSLVSAIAAWHDYVVEHCEVDPGTEPELVEVLESDDPVIRATTSHD